MECTRSLCMKSFGSDYTERLEQTSEGFTEEHKLCEKARRGLVNHCGYNCKGGPAIYFSDCAIHRQEMGQRQVMFLRRVSPLLNNVDLSEDDYYRSYRVLNPVSRRAKATPRPLFQYKASADPATAL